MISAEQGQIARRVLVKRAAQLDPDGQAELFLSGGVDSATILFALLEAGRRPRCLTFQLGDTVSVDAAVAASMCAAFGLEHTVVRLPRDTEQLLADVRWVLGHVDWRQTTVKKTIVQCCHPALYLYPAMHGAYGLWGLSGDDIMRTNRQLALDDYHQGWQKFSRLRRSSTDDPRFTDYHVIDIGRRVFGKRIEDFYNFPAWWAWVQQFPTPEVNHPKQKYAALIAFPDYWRRGNWYRTNSPYQINSGIRQYHDLLLDRPEFADCTVVQQVYRRLAQELDLEVNTQPYQSPYYQSLDFKDFADAWT